MPFLPLKVASVPVTVVAPSPSPSSPSVLLVRMSTNINTQLNPPGYLGSNATTLSATTYMNDGTTNTSLNWSSSKAVSAL